jgi:heme oxygenase (biliverdin-producing, ferredoxin)
MTDTPVATGTTMDRLRAATAAAHTRAEGSAFIGHLMEGELDADAYRSMAAQQYFIYEALESVCDQLVDDPVAAVVMDERLRRLPRLSADLEALGVAVSGVELLPSTAEYAKSIRDSAADPVTFLAHHYTRYLGDLSGGQILRSRMKLHYGLTDDVLSFYVFDIDKLKRFKDAYAASLDGLLLDEHAVTRLLDEAVRAFGFNEALFAELGTHTG